MSRRRSCTTPRPPSAGATSEVTIVLDGRTTTAAMPQDQSILDAAAATRSDLPFACKGGVCGTCRARVTEGEVDMRRNYALSEDEVGRGFVLTCQSRPVSAAVTVDLRRLSGHSSRMVALVFLPAWWLWSSFPHGGSGLLVWG